MSALERFVVSFHLGHDGGYLEWVPRVGTVCLGLSDFGEGSEVMDGDASSLGAELRSAEGLGVCGPSITREWDSMNSRSFLILSTLVWTASGFPYRKRSTRFPKRSRLALTVTNRFSIVLNVISWTPLKRRQAQLV